MTLHHQKKRTSLQIESLTDRYRLHHIFYQGELCTVDWSKELLDEGKRQSQSEWIALTQDTRWKIPDMPLYHATLAALYHYKDHPETAQKKLVQEMQELFQADFDPTKPGMATSSRIRYDTWKNVNPRDRVIHGQGYAGAQTEFFFLDGPKMWINSSFDRSLGLLDPHIRLGSIMETLLHSNDLAEIEHVYEWVSGKKPYLCRLSSSPDCRTERAVALDSTNDKFNIDCYVSVSRQARGAIGMSL